jgi:hypothetical protein
MKNALSLIAFGFLAACAQATPINTGSGKSAYFIECPGAAMASECIKKANELCPSGYVIDDASRTYAGGGTVIAHSPTMATVTPGMVQNSLTVSCK